MSQQKNWGGHRPGAGRPKKTYEPTKRIVVPVRLLEKFYAWLKAELEKDDAAKE